MALGFAGGNDFVDNVFNRYREKTMKVGDAQRQFNEALSQVDRNTADFMRNLNAQKRMANLRLNQADFNMGLLNQAEGALDFADEQAANRSAAAWGNFADILGTGAEWYMGDRYAKKLKRDAYDFDQNLYGDWQ